MHRISLFFGICSTIISQSIHNNETTLSLALPIRVSINSNKVQICVPYVNISILDAQTAEQ